MMPNATAPLEVSTPIKFHMPDQTTATMRFERVRVNHGGYGVGGVMEAIHELEAQGDKERHAEKHKGHHSRRVHVREVGNQMATGIDEADYQGHAENKHA